ncbi:glycosyltransferase [[Pseudomonas] carboxydohydrogena]|uniref:Glycosyltransferase n=1 Tax=Afipia carboxydohydrogena TaxID=290 RepID=A0ABY8BPC0_AFICR|nr:glycosyltransferase family 2 protein [[Pseudomonas] carboxydohydrogena]WEF51386.1 glycosyltransferase [[Pseudomonas] carboxydohydrogena]
MAPISGHPNDMAGPVRKIRRRRPAWPYPGLLPDLLKRPRVQPAAAPPRRETGHPFELDCLHGVLPSEILAEAVRCAGLLGVGADQVLIRRGIITETEYVVRLAQRCELAVEGFRDIARTDCPLTDAQLRYAAQHRMLPLERPDGLYHVQAPLGLAARRIAALCARQARPRIRLATRAAFDRYLMRHEALAHDAAEGLALQLPEMSCAPIHRDGGGRIRRYLLHLPGLTGAFVLAPVFIIQFCGAVLAIWFLLFNSLRFAGSLAGNKRPQPLDRLSDEHLPIYTVMVALYREGRSVAHLLHALAELDYPREKLDIKLLLEADDRETQAAIARLDLPPNVEILLVPPFGPRTKPKALNAGLPFARGDFVAVFDAEDRPDPSQLRAALDTFRRHGGDVACAQASLCIDNSADSWLACMFTAEYAGQFDAFLRGFSQFGLPLPLGGSSNHFRTATLREVGGWDAYNVTEDADLGFRLARFGYRAVMFSSTTYEEAPARAGAWLRQRSRWMKGWMQTWIVHMRSPLRLIRQSGLAGFFTLNLLVGGNVLTALAYPMLIGACLLEIGLTAAGSTAIEMFADPFAGLHLATIAAGCLSTVVVCLIGLTRRRLLHHAWVLLLTPLYWACLSVAAWRALIQLFRDPYRWEKTEHGLARHSRLAAHSAGRKLKSNKGRENAAFAQAPAVRNNA